MIGIWWYGSKRSTCRMLLLQTSGGERKWGWWATSHTSVWQSQPPVAGAYATSQCCWNATRQHAHVWRSVIWAFWVSSH